MHDKHGQPLAVGDKVVIRGTVKSTYGGLFYCNCDVELDEPMPVEDPSSDRAKSTITLNTNQVEKDLAGTRTVVNELQVDRAEPTIGQLPPLA